jgi:hypothetical protein
MLDAIETTIGTAAVLKIFDGTLPANCAAADDGNVLASITLASDWAAAASGGAKAWSGTPVTDASADASGDATYFRLYASDGTTCHEQGTVTATGGGGDVTLDSITLTATQSFSITAWSWTAPGA